MAIAALIETPGGSQEQYVAILNALGMELGVAPGPRQIFHGAGPYEGRWKVIDVWESREAFETFVREHLMSVMEKVGGP